MINLQNKFKDVDHNSTRNSFPCLEGGVNITDHLLLNTKDKATVDQITILGHMGLYSIISNLR